LRNLSIKIWLFRNKAINLHYETDLKNVLNYVRLLSANIRNIFIERKINSKKIMIKSQKVIVTLKPSIKAKINDIVITNLSLKTSEKYRTIKDWLKKDSEKLTHYSFLLALSELLQLPIDQLINIERC